MCQKQFSDWFWITYNFWDATNVVQDDFSGGSDDYFCGGAIEGGI